MRPHPNSGPRYTLSNHVSTFDLSKSNKSFVRQLSVVSIPISMQEALADPWWKEAMEEVLRSLMKNATWEVIDLPNGNKPVEYILVYIVKFKADRTVNCFKVRLVVERYI